MIEHTAARLLQVVADPHGDFAARLQSIQSLTQTPDRSLVPRFRALLDRPRPNSEPSVVNWDAWAAERVIDLHIIASLHALGDDSEIHRLVPLVKQAGKVLVGPYDELRNAATAIIAIGRVDVISWIIDLTADRDPAVVRNAVVLLDRLALPEPPAHQDISGLPRLSEKVTFTITTLKEELEGLATLSHGTVELSPGTKQLIVTSNYDRGVVRRVGTALRDIVVRVVPLLDLDYYVKDGQVVICTHIEAGARWQEWWKAHGGDLMYQPDTKSFVLRR